MPYSREQMRLYQRRRRAKAKGQQVPNTGNIAEAHNINEGMKATKEKPLTWEEYHPKFPDMDFPSFLEYRKEHLAATHAQEIEDYRQKQSAELTLEFGTKNKNCIRWRQMYEAGQKSDFYYDHIDQCKSCMRWYADQRLKGKTDINNVGRKAESFEELKGYEEAFGESKADVEDFAYSPNGGIPFPMSRCCGQCGGSLDENGRCAQCGRYEDD